MKAFNGILCKQPSFLFRPVQKHRVFQSKLG